MSCWLSTWKNNTQKKAQKKITDRLIRNFESWRLALLFCIIYRRVSRNPQKTHDASCVYNVHNLYYNIMLLYIVLATIYACVYAVSFILLYFCIVLCVLCFWTGTLVKYIIPNRTLYFVTIQACNLVRFGDFHCTLRRFYVSCADVPRR